MELTVYKASAGSGKTYTLTREYLKQALKYANNPYIFKSILAVTFTNKATEEMKSRIVATLNELAHDKNPNLSQELQNEFGISAHDLQEQAKKVRSAILHDYTYFAVSTIDAFFQRVIHAFVREAGLRPGFNLELDTKRLLDEAVDNLMLSASTDESLRRWLFSLIENRIENRTSWDMRPMLIDIGQKVFDEEYRRYGADFHTKTADRKFMENYAGNIYRISSTFEAKMTSIGNQAIDCIEKSGLTVADFKNGKSGFINHFYKIQRGDYAAPLTRVNEALESIDNWTTKTSKRKAEIEAIYPTLYPLLKESVDYWDTDSRQYYTAFEVLKKLRELGVLADIAKNVRDIAGDENLMPISDSVHLLSTLINDSDTPFVYERTGNRYKTFMIDEFQDTSISQWSNFRPLLHNSLAEGQFSMVVGDIKQSIYRWRNGDWRILSYYLDRDFSQFGLIHQNLATNWRSKAVIVEFNNGVFKHLSNYMQALFTSEMEENTTGLSINEKELLSQIIPIAYTDSAQQASSKTKSNEGYVSIEVFESDDNGDSTDKVLENLPQTIIDLQNRGYHANDIAILVRNKRDGQAVANCLLNYKKIILDKKYCFDVISQDSLFIENARVVQIIIAALRVATNPDDLISAAFLSYATNRNVNTATAHNSFTNKLDDEELIFINQLLNQSLTEAFELLIQHYQLNTNIDELPFLQELHDCIANFSNRKLSDISSFLEWWDDKGHTSTLSPGQKQNAINILTIHKSKGLQYPVVIVPFANWSIEPRRQTTMWFSPKNEPFNQLPVVPVVYSKDLQKTDFNPDYLIEKVQSYIDNINLLYVAFTRAENELYISLPQSKRDGAGRVSSVLNNFFKQFAGVSETFSFGELQGKQTETGLKLEFGDRKNYTTSQDLNEGLILQSYPSSELKRKLRLKYESEDYFGDTVSTTPIQRRNYGILMHRVFANINSADEYVKAIDSLLQEGLIDDDGKIILIQKIEKALKNPIAKTWFDGTWSIKSEGSLLLPQIDDISSILIQRPDRVMMKENETIVIDYKFGINESKQYEKQLSRYLHLLFEMNYPTIKGYIWYVDLDRITECTVSK